MLHPHRAYEDDTLSVLANESRGSFIFNYEKTIKYLMKNPSGLTDPRVRLNMRPEPYRPSAEIESDSTLLCKHALAMVSSNIQKWEWLYDNLGDAASQRLLLLVLAYRALGWKYVRLPLDNDNFWNAVSSLGQLGEPNRIPEDFSNKDLQYANLRPIGRDVAVYSDAFGLFNEFLYPQYSYRGLTEIHTVKNGDYVIDCGACYGGTSLNFADLAGPTGRVYSFEFMPENLLVYRHNVNENINLQNRISLIEKAVWSQSDKIMSITGSGPAAQVHLSDIEGAANIKSIKIDDFVKEAGLPTVNFIKMDIEGSEIEALKGAMNTIERFRPVMAICVYHNISDFYEVPRLLKGIHEDYKIYFGHSTMHGDESVIFAV
ncbi:FkbM family methyltransferase [Aquisediminimonas sediminicola]|uniref:FkbM family methyltransferase n=1 Tax=Alteraquisediminimonas sediminicola TaxID=2676787 RepID=UPI001C8D28B1|nr:FkbM family methyltransferase [Aquisediminimonas sediminicola]